MVVIIYCRVSTNMQEEKESLQYQIKKCEDYCKENGYTIKNTLKDVESGGNDDRHGFQELQDEIKHKTFDALVVYETSRISRVSRTMQNFVYDLQMNDIKFISISQPELNTTTPTGRLFFHLQASLAEYERMQISERVKSNMYQRAKEGRWLGGDAPIGYKVVDKKLIPDPLKVEEVRNLFNYYIQEQSLSKCAKKFKRKIESIKWILENPVYIGKKRYGQKTKNITTGIITINDEYGIFEGQHDGIIEEETFYLVQSIIASNSYKKGGTSKYLLSGLLECGCCGGKLHGLKQKKKSGKVYLYYHCKRKGCRKKYPLAEVEDKFLSKLYNASALASLNDVEVIHTNKEVKIKRLNRKLESLAREKSNLTSYLIKGVIPEEEYKIQLNKLTSEEAQLRDELSLCSKEEEVIQNKIDNLQLFMNVMDNLEPEDITQARKILKLIIEKAVVSKKEKVIDVSLELKF